MLKKFINHLSQNKLLLPVAIFIFFGIITRFLWLEKIPVGITHDDADVILSAKSFFLLGKDISGTLFPTSLFINHTAGNISGLPSFILAIFIGSFKLSLFTTHLVYVFVNLITLLFISLISYNFIKSSKIFLVIFTVGLLNPWMFSYSRYPTEAPFALMFVAIACFFAFRKKPVNILISTFFFILSFYSYFGAKVVIPVLFPVIIFVRYFLSEKDFKNTKIYLVSLTVFTLMVGGYFWIVLKSPTSTFNRRAVGEFVFSDMTPYQVRVDEIRRASINYPLKNIFVNKYILLAENVAGKYFGWFSQDFLFKGGDPEAVYRFDEHGLFYYLDIVLFTCGFIWLFKENKSNSRNVFGLILLILILTAPIGSSISAVGNSYYFRSFLLIPAVLILLGFGFYYLLEISGLNKFTKLVFYLFLLIYVLSFANFISFYFFRYPVKNSDNEFLGSRILSNYIKRSLIKTDKNITVFTIDPLNAYKLYLFYSNGIDKNTPIFFGNVTDINFGRVYFTNNCFYKHGGGVLIYDAKANCKIVDENPIIIENQKDAGSQHSIYADSLCGEEKLDAYRRDHRLSDYRVEGLDNTAFCNRWLFRYER